MAAESGGCSSSRSGSEFDPPFAAGPGTRAAYPHGKRDLRSRAATWMRVASGIVLVAIAAISWWLAISSGCATGDAVMCRSTSNALQSVHVADLPRLTNASAARETLRCRSSP